MPRYVILEWGEYELLRQGGDALHALAARLDQLHRDAKHVNAWMQSQRVPITAQQSMDRILAMTEGI